MTPVGAADASVALRLSDPISPGHFSAALMMDTGVNVRPPGRVHSRDLCAPLGGRG